MYCALLLRGIIVAPALVGVWLAPANLGRTADFLGDSREELVVGAPGAGDQPRSGVAFLYRGGAAGVVATEVLDQSSFGGNVQGDEFGAAFAVGDFDGDGAVDLAVGAPGESGSGAVYIWRGTGGGLSPAAALDQTGLGAAEPGDRFGAALAAGDFDKDGYVDLAVGAPYDAPNSRVSGAVYLFLGGPAGLRPGRLVDQTGLGVDEHGDRFGAALSSGDYDGDGHVDLAVGAPGEAPGSDPRSGAVYLFRGSSRGVSPAQVLDQAGLSANEADDQFGAALASGDFDNDGHEDLAVGAPYEAPGAGPRSGAVFIFAGTPMGLEPRQFLVQDGLGVNEAGDDFGRALSSGDYDCDGWADLAVGAPGEAPGGDPRSGAVFVFRGTDKKLVPLQVLTQTGLADNEHGDRFGAALASANYVANHREDLAVGAPGGAPRADPRSGAVYLFRGTASGLTPQQPIDQTKLGINEAGDRFGVALCE
ncbi:MAG: FG-GAP-like repeat-containing protein [Enhygromyxa sp.]